MMEPVFEHLNHFSLIDTKLNSIQLSMFWFKIFSAFYIEQ